MVKMELKKWQMKCVQTIKLVFACKASLEGGTEDISYIPNSRNTSEKGIRISGLERALGNDLIQPQEF